MFVVALISCLVIVPLGTTAYAAGSDSPTPYAVTKDGIQLPAGSTFSDNGHVNIKATGSTWKDLHFEGKCITRTDAECSGDRHAAAQYIGKSFIPWEAFGLKEPFCVTWAQLAQYNEHFGEGGQKPVCVGNDTPPEDDTDTKKVEFCHATGSESNPYVLLDTSVNAFYQAGHDTHQDGRDIVPPFSYKKKGQTISFLGLNWDATGQAIFKNGCEVPKPPTTCVKDSPTYVWGPKVVSVTGAEPGTWLPLYDAPDKANQTLISKVKVGEDCKASLPVPPAKCEPHQYQGDHSSTEPPATITDITGDGIADVPGWIEGELFTVPGDDSLCTPPPTNACPDLPGSQPVGTDCTPTTTPPVVTPECPDGFKWSDRGECQSIGTPISFDLPSQKKSTTPVTRTPYASVHRVLPGTGSSTSPGEIWAAIGVVITGVMLMVGARRKKSVA